MENRGTVEIINLTPHDLNIYLDNGEVITVKTSGTVARCREVESIIGYLNDRIPIYNKQLGDVTGLPESRPGTIYVVSLLVAQALKGQRNDLYVVNGSVRDSSGRIIGVRGLSRL